MSVHCLLGKIYISIFSSPAVHISKDYTRSCHFFKLACILLCREEILSRRISRTNPHIYCQTTGTHSSYQTQRDADKHAHRVVWHKLFFQILTECAQSQSKNASNLFIYFLYFNLFFKITITLTATVLTCPLTIFDERHLWIWREKEGMARGNGCCIRCIFIASQ